MDALKPTVEAFHKGVRWKDFRGAAAFIVPERRASFVRARELARDERDLTISDFSSEDAAVEPDALSAKVVSNMAWFRLPNTTEQSAVVESLFVWRTSGWMLESQSAGPFPELLPSPSPSPAPQPSEAPQKKAPTVSGPAEAVGDGKPPMGFPD